MAFVRKIKGSLVRVDSSDYVGEESYLFYDIDTACLRITDGTPGGRPACIEGLTGGTGGSEPSTTVPPNTVTTAATIFDFDSTVDIAVKYLVVIENLITGESQSAEVHAFGGLGKNTFNIHNKLGDRIKYNLALIVNGVTREMQIINLEPHDIKIRVTRLGAVKL